jgi:hypothetical protein
VEKRGVWAVCCVQTATLTKHCSLYKGKSKQGKSNRANYIRENCFFVE